MIQAIADRYSCRNYSTAHVDKETVMQILEAARLAPSACNRQPWTFYVVTDEAKRRTMLAKSRQAFVDAPVLIVAVGHHSQAWHRPSDGKDHTDIDLAIAVEHICLEAEAQGLGTCWVCSFDTEATKSELALADGDEPVALIPLGYLAEDEVRQQNKTRKDIAEIVKWVD